MGRAPRSQSGSLDNLRKSAKRWLKALRASDPDAISRFRRAYPNAPPQPGLRDVQHALARERGHASWIDLRDTVTDAAPVDAAPDHRRRVEAFLEFACWDHRLNGTGDYRMAAASAVRILRRHPEVARDSLYTAIVCGDVEHVETVLDARPELATQKGGSRDWEPLLYLAYARLPLSPSNDNAIPIARTLLDRGADPNAAYPAGHSQYSVLVGIAGEGEQDAPPHPRREELYQLLLERGAGPYDIQVLYNTHFHGDVRWWLELTYAQAVKAGRESDWDDPDWPMLDMGGYGNGARFLLWTAMEKARDLGLAEWLLAHGANPNAAPSRAPRLSKTSLYEEALRLDFPEMADLLVRYGATPVPLVLDDEDAFVAASTKLDRDAALALLARHPGYLRSPRAMFRAIQRDRADVVAFLLDLGTSVDIEDSHQQSALHQAASHDAIASASLLIERGAAIDPRDSTYNNTPLGYAAHYWHRRMLALLSKVSRDVWNLAYIGDAARLREVLAEDPARARAVNRRGVTPLWWLPDEEGRALEIVELLLANGADPSVPAPDGSTAAELATKRGLDDVARMLEAAARNRPPRAPHQLYAVDSREQKIRVRRALRPAEWEIVIGAMKEQRVVSIESNGQMTDAMLERTSHFDHVTRLNLSGSIQLTDEGLRHLARMPQLQSLELTGCRITDRGLEILRDLPDLREFRLYHHDRVTDAGTMNLRHCERLERVFLLGSAAGDGTIRALAGKPMLRTFQAGTEFTEAGLMALHDFPVFKTWQGRERRFALMEFQAEPNYLLLHPSKRLGPHGIANLAGLDGLFALNLDNPRVRHVDLSPLFDLPNLGWLGFDADDETMTRIAELPRLQMLMVQDTSAGDRGFSALGRSRSIEYIWGRRCYALGSRGFAALSAMPALKGLSVSCRNVGFDALATLPRFPALRELMPMDVPDEGFEHVGRCSRLEALWCMYCRDTTDAATAHIVGLRELKTYYAGQTRITDRTLEMLGTMNSLEQITFWNCAGVTDEGLKYLAALPRLRQLDLDGMANVSLEATSIFPAHVRVNYSA